MVACICFRWELTLSSTVRKVLGLDVVDLTVVAWRPSSTGQGEFLILVNAEFDMAAIEIRVKQVIAKQLGINETAIANESSFVDDLGADSLDTVELVMALEEEFGTEIPDDKAEKITTVQQAIDYIKSNVKEE